MRAALSTDIVIVGGGIIGMSLAYGLVRAGQRVTVLDDGDDVLRAARGNFGLVWVQGKGLTHAEYARWTLTAAAAWPAWAAELTETSGVDVALSQIGGFRLSFDDVELTRRAVEMARIAEAIDKDYPFERLNASEVRARLPDIGPDVVGGIFSPLDGHVSPLKLLRALVEAFRRLGGELRTGERVETIESHPGEFVAHTAKARYASGRVVLAAGLGNRSLAALIGLNAPVVPVRGQVLVTERMVPFLRYPTLHVRQTDEGVIQIGDSKEQVGFDDRTTTGEIARIARDAARYFPVLSNVNVVRSWGALRVMTPDGYPIYHAAETHPGAYLVTCHSGVTLAPNHGGVIADWLRGASRPAGIDSFTADRFHV